jgi:hypothetical protein
LDVSPPVDRLAALDFHSSLSEPFPSTTRAARLFMSSFRGRAVQRASHDSREFWGVLFFLQNRLSTPFGLPITRAWRISRPPNQPKRQSPNDQCRWANSRRTETIS